MESLLTISGCTRLDETRVYAAWHEAESRLEGKLEALPDAVSPLVVSVIRRDESPHWRAEAALHIPPQTLVAECASDAMKHAVAEVAGGIARQIDRWLQHPGELVRRREGLEAVDSLLDRCRSNDDARTFLALLSPLAWSLAPYVGRELQLAEFEGQASAAGLEPVEVLDEVVLRAWAMFAQRPSDLPLDLWLIRLTDGVLREITLSGNFLARMTSLEERLDLPDGEPASSFRDEWIEQVNEQSSVQLAELLPDDENVANWDRLDVDAKHTAIARLLEPLDRPARQALILTAVEGFNIAEVADFQQRAPESVQEDVARGKAQIGRELAETDWFRQQEQIERAMQPRHRRR